MSSQLDVENELLQAIDGLGPDHSLRTAPILTGDAVYVAGASAFPQRALYGRVIEQEVDGFPREPVSPKLYININESFSAVVCGVQGSGKSHSTSVLLESCLIKDPRLGALPAPFSGVLFHFDTAAGRGSIQPCDAAYLACLDPTSGKNATPPRVTVLVLPTALQNMRKVYAGLPQVRVEPLHFTPSDIGGQRLLAMMKVDTDPRAPLYMESIMAILRSMDSFDYVRFRKALDAQKFDSTQKAMLSLRLALLDACLEGGDANNRVPSHFHEGQLTIIDLSSPYMDSSSACGLFNIILGLFIEANLPAGKLVVLDEAHKYLTENGSSASLTDSLLAVIRQQRHLATRIVISTQEPTVVPGTFLDLCTFIIAHRFTSPRWFKHLAKDIPAEEKMGEEWFAKIVSLGTGEAMLFAPAGLGAAMKGKGKVRADGKDAELRRFGQGYLLVRSRLRITRDGGPSLLSVTHPAEVLRFGRVNASGQRSASARATDATSSSMPEISPQANTLPPSASSSKPAPVSTRFTHDEAFHAFATEDEQSSAETEESTAEGSGNDTEMDAGPVYERGHYLPAHGSEDRGDTVSQSASSNDTSPSSSNLRRRGSSLPTDAEVPDTLSITSIPSQQTIRSDDMIIAAENKRRTFIAAGVLGVLGPAELLPTPYEGPDSGRRLSPANVSKLGSFRFDRSESRDTFATDDYMSVAEELTTSMMDDRHTTAFSPDPPLISGEESIAAPATSSQDLDDLDLPVVTKTWTLSLDRSATPTISTTGRPPPTVRPLTHSWSNPQFRFHRFIIFLVKQHAQGVERVSLCEAVHFLDREVKCPYLGQTVTAFLDDAARLGLLVRGSDRKDAWIAASEYAPIVHSLLFDMHSHGGQSSANGTIASLVRKNFPTVLARHGWAPYLKAAMSKGVVSRVGDQVSLCNQSSTELPRQPAISRVSSSTGAPTLVGKIYEDIPPTKTGMTSDLSSAVTVDTPISPLPLIERAPTAANLSGSDLATDKSMIQPLPSLESADGPVPLEHTPESEPVSFRAQESEPSASAETAGVIPTQIPSPVVFPQPLQSVQEDAPLVSPASVAQHERSTLSLLTLPQLQRYDGLVQVLEEQHADVALSDLHSLVSPSSDAGAFAMFVDGAVQLQLATLRPLGGAVVVKPMPFATLAHLVRKLEKRYDRAPLMKVKEVVTAELQSVLHVTDLGVILLREGNILVQLTGESMSL